MRKLWILVAVIFLMGCKADTSEMSKALAFRQKLLTGNGCNFTAEIAADFGDKTYSFTMECTGEADGSLAFSVQKPDTISGIRGVLSGKGGKITFDEDRAVAFPMLAEGRVTPISAPWILYNTLRSGYILACGTEGQQLRLTINDSYEEESLQVDVWLNEEGRPNAAEIYWQGRRVLSMCVINFQIL